MKFNTTNMMVNFTKLLLTAAMLTGALTFPAEAYSEETAAAPRKGLPLPNKFPMAEDPMILTPPEGTVTNWVTYGFSYMMTWDGVSMEENYNSISQMVETDEGEVFILGLIPSQLSPGWVKGTRDGDIITIPIPQRVEEIPFGDVTYVYQINVLDYIEGEPLDIFAFDVNESVANITLSKTETGWHLDLPGNGSQILGITCGNEGEQIWVGYADIYTTWSPIPWTETLAPSLETSQYAMVNDGEGHLVDIAFDNSACYIKGLSPFFPNGWIKGEMKGRDEIIFPSNQFLGVKNVNGVEMGLFQGAIYGEVYDEYFDDVYMDFIPQSDAVFAYEPESSTFNMHEQAILVNTCDTITRCLETYWEPTLYPQPKDISLEPQQPIAVGFSETASSSVYGTATFRLSNLNSEGFVMPKEDLFYTVKIDGTPIEINNDPYIPYNYSQYDIIYRYGVERWVRIYDSSAKTLEVELIYKPQNGEEVHSPVMVLSLDPSGVDTVTDPNDEIRYYDLTGRQILAPAPGSMVIKVVGQKSYKVII